MPLAPEHHLGPLHGERQLLAKAVSTLCCAAVKPDLPPGGRSHYSKDGFQLQELSEKAGHELQTPSGEPEREAGDWHGAKPEPRSHRVAQSQEATMWSSSKRTTAAPRAAGVGRPRPVRRHGGLLSQRTPKAKQTK